MAFRIKRRERVTSAVRRIVREELRDARAEAADSRAPLDVRVHAVRTRVKRARSTLRLARRDRGSGARALDHRLRDLSRVVANARDAAIAEEVLRAHARPGEPLPALAGPDADERRDLDRALRELRRLPGSLSRWSLSGDGRSARRAVAASFREARRLGATLRPHSSTEAFHSWRKVVKRLGLQLRVVGSAVPELDRALERSVEQLSDLLGEIHDLAVTRERLEKARVSSQRKPDTRAMLARLAARDRDTRAEALALGASALAPRPRFVKASLRTGWRTWRRH